MNHSTLQLLLENALQMEQNILEQMEQLSRVLWQARGRIATLRELMEAPDGPTPLDPGAVAVAGTAKPADVDPYPAA